VLLLLFWLAWWLNRRGRYYAAVYLMMTCAVLAPWVAILFDPKILHGDFVPPLYLGLSVMLATILLPERATLVLAVVQVGGYLALMIVSPTPSFNWPSLVIFTLTLTLLSVVTNILTRDDMRQIEHQNELLIAREAQLRELSVRDPVTGVFNRRYMEETLERELHRARRKQQSLGVILVDVDHFKHVNDHYGHAAGDAVLQFLGECFRSVVRGADIVCRYGGDEFVFMLPEASLEDTRRLADELLAVVARRIQERDRRRPVNVTLSLGVAAYPQHGQDGSALLAAADVALYRAKRAGRNRVEVAAVD
jgi:diguanylate cyclase (GGDEF)-like protein